MTKSLKELKLELEEAEATWDAADDVVDIARAYANASDAYHTALRKETNMTKRPLITMDKTYTNEWGNEAFINTVEGKEEEFPVLGAIKIDGVWHNETWTADGSFEPGSENMRDLIEIEPRIKREYWINIYPHESGNVTVPRLTKAAAYSSSGPDRIACVKIFVDCKKGEGL
jgi:hypothetical protein